MAFGTTPKDSSQVPLGTVYTQGTANGNLTTLQGGPIASADASGNQSAPVATYTPDGNDVVQGTTTDANTVNTHMGRLTKIRDLLAGTISAGLAAGSALIGGVQIVDSLGTNKAGVDANNGLHATLYGTHTTTGDSPIGADVSNNLTVKVNTALPAGANTIGNVGGVGVAGTPAGGVVSIQGVASGTAIPISGSITATNPSVGTDGSAIPLSSTLLGASDGTNLQPLQVDASKFLKVNVAAGTISSTNPAVGTDGSAIPTSSTLIGASDGTNLQQLLVESATNRNLRVGIYNGALEATVTAANALKVDGSAVTQPVSGTFWQATQPVSAASLPLPTGAALEAGHLATIDTSTARIPAQGQALMAASTPVVIASNQSAVPVSGTFFQATQPVSGTFWQATQPVSLSSVAASLSQANQVPVSNAGQQGALALSISSLTANADNSITFTGNATVARRIRLQNESSGTIYWYADAAASTGSPSLPAPAANAVMVEWINAAITTLHIWIPTGGTTVLNGSGGVKVTAWA